MNLLTLRAQTRFKANFDNTTDLTNAQILTHLNEAQRILAVKITKVNEDFFEEQKSKFNLVADQDLYALPTDLIKFKQLRLAYSAPSNEEDYKIATGYNPANVETVNSDEESIPSNNPIVDITNNYMRIKPDPSANITNGGEIYYIARPSALVATGDVSVIPEDYHDLMASYAAWKTCQRFSKKDRAADLKGEWYEGITQMMEDLAGRELNFPKAFTNLLATSGGKNKTTQELY